MVIAFETCAPFTRMPCSWWLLVQPEESSSLALLPSPSGTTPRGLHARTFGASYPGVIPRRHTILSVLARVKNLLRKPRMGRGAALGFLCFQMEKDFFIDVCCKSRGFRA